MNMLVSAAALTATATPVLAASPDAAIIAAADQLHRLKPFLDAAQTRSDETFAEFRARRPERPKELKWHPSDGLNVGHYGRGGGVLGGPWLDPTDLRGLRGVPQLRWTFVGPGGSMSQEMWDDKRASPKNDFQHLFESEHDERNQRRLEAAIEAQDIDDARCAALKAEIGCDVAERQLNEIYCQIEPLQKIVVDTEAQTTAGLRAKAATLIEWYFEDSDRDEEYEMTEYEKLVSDVVNGLAELAA